MQKTNRAFLAIGLLVSGLVIAGCSSSPSEEELRQLNDLKAEVASLQRDVSAREQRKSALDSDIAEKNAKLQKCNEDKQVVRQRLGQ